MFSYEFAVGCISCSAIEKTCSLNTMFQLVCYISGSNVRDGGGLKLAIAHPCLKLLGYRDLHWVLLFRLQCTGDVNCRK
jgi:hypothetical protein